MESIVDELLLEIGATTNTSTLVHGRTRFAVPKSRKKLLKQEKQCAQTDTKYCIAVM